MAAVLSVAAAQPFCAARDVRANGLAHAAAVRAADARVVVFPELSLTGYELDADVVSPQSVSLFPIVEACAATGSIALVGAPVRDPDGHSYIAMLRASCDGVEVAYRKTWLDDAEAARFTSGPGPTVIQVDGWRLGMGICKDTGIPEHVQATAALGIDAYLAGLVNHVEDLPVQDARACTIATGYRAYVVFAGVAGPTGGGYDRTAGSSTIWSPTGEALARAGSAVDGIARAALPRLARGPVDR